MDVQQLHQEISDVGIPEIVTAVPVAIGAQMSQTSASIVDLYRDLTLQGKMMLWAGVVLLIVQLVVLMRRSVSLMITTLFFGIIYIVYYTYNINCLVTGGCGTLAYILAGLMIINTVITVAHILFKTGGVTKSKSKSRR